MHLLECYSVTAGAQIGSCFIHEEKIDLPQTPYITFHGYNPKGQSRQYDYWHKVIYQLKNNPNFNYDIIQVGGANDKKYDVNTNYLGKTSYHSLAYLIKHASLHLGFDSLPVHLASYYSKKIVAIYAHYSANTGPFFSNTNDIILLQPDHSKIKPVFADIDPFNQINTIDSNQIYESILSLLDIK
jgi:ADP-heptose:LPS heptosyltransferase